MFPSEFREKYKDVIEKWGISYMCHFDYGFSHLKPTDRPVYSAAFGAFGLRNDGPNQIRFTLDGKEELHEYYNDRHQHHREDGPAMIWLTDRSLDQYYLNGVQVNEQIVKYPQNQTITDILGEQNSDVQRIRVERYGWLRFLKATKAEPIDVAENPVENTIESLFGLHTVPNGYDTWQFWHMKVLVCACPSTARVYVIEVPKRFIKCETARRWLLGNRFKRMKLIGAS